jgi:hypothetical protein
MSVEVRLRLFLEPECVPPGAERAVEVGDLHVDMTDVDTRVNDLAHDTESA